MKAWFWYLDSTGFLATHSVALVRSVFHAVLIRWFSFPGKQANLFGPPLGLLQLFLRSLILQSCSLLPAAFFFSLHHQYSTVTAILNPSIWNNLGHGGCGVVDGVDCLACLGSEGLDKRKDWLLPTTDNTLQHKYFNPQSSFWNDVSNWFLINETSHTTNTSAYTSRLQLG